MIATARTLTPAEGLQLGIINRLYPDGVACIAAAIEYATAIADGPSEAVGRAKVAACLGYGDSLDAGLALEREAVAHVFASQDDAAEGISAFAEKRGPVFRGH